MSRHRPMTQTYKGFTKGFNPKHSNKSDVEKRDANTSALFAVTKLSSVQRVAQINEHHCAAGGGMP